LILVTHSHPDHFDAAQVEDAAKRTHATVIGPASVITRLQTKLPKESLVELEPVASKGVRITASRSVELPLARVTAFRTFHSSDHNSYLVEMKGFCFFHDGDNEDTRRIDRGALGRIDALFIATWQGAAWAEFIEAVQPSRWFLMHMTDEELAEHRKGAYLPDLCDHIPLPDKLVALSPGQSYEMSSPAVTEARRHPPRMFGAGERDCGETQCVSPQSLAPARQAGRGRAHCN